MTDANIIDLFITIVFGLTCFYCGYKYHQYRMVQEIVEMSKRILDKIGKIEGEDDAEVIRKSSADMHPLKHEEHNGVHFFYYEADDGFACQGTTLEEAAKKFKEVTKGEGIGFFAIESGTNKGEYAFVDGEVCDAAIKKVVL